MYVYICVRVFSISACELVFLCFCVFACARVFVSVGVCVCLRAIVVNLKICVCLSVCLCTCEEAGAGIAVVGFVRRFGPRILFFFVSVTGCVVLCVRIAFVCVSVCLCVCVSVYLCVCVSVCR